MHYTTLMSTLHLKKKEKKEEKRHIKLIKGQKKLVKLQILLFYEHVNFP